MTDEAAEAVRDELRRRVRAAIADGVDPAKLPGLDATAERVLEAIVQTAIGPDVGAFRRSLARRGLDLLLATTPHLELVEAEWQNGGPWLLVTLGQRSEAASTDALDVFARHPYAIWKSTGAVYGMDAPGGPVHDDPILEP